MQQCICTFNNSRTVSLARQPMLPDHKTSCIGKTWCCVAVMHRQYIPDCCHGVVVNLYYVFQGHAQLG